MSIFSSGVKTGNHTHKERTSCYENEPKRKLDGGSYYGPNKKLSWLKGRRDTAEKKPWVRLSHGIFPPGSM